MGLTPPTSASPVPGLKVWNTTPAQGKEGPGGGGEMEGEKREGGVAVVHILNPQHSGAEADRCIYEFKHTLVYKGSF